MDRRTFIGSLAGGFLAAPIVGEAQQPGKRWRIGSVLAGSQESTGRVANAIESSLAAAGYIAGRNITLEHRYYRPDPAGADEVLRAVVPAADLLVVGGTIGAVVARKITTVLPTVFLSVGDPVRVGLVSSLAHPGGNMTGVTFEAASETYGKRLQLLKEILPGLTVAGILRVPSDANIVVAMESLERVAPGLGVTILPFDISTVDDLSGVFVRMKSSGVQAVLVVAGAFTYTHGRRIAELAMTQRLPSAHAFRETAAAGGLLSLGPDIVAMAPQVAAYVDKILKGTKPGELPVEQPTTYELIINLKTAKALGLTIPQSLLQRADQVIE
jgi:putative ABC transport system substrate-binding protein